MPCIDSTVSLFLKNTLHWFFTQATLFMHLRRQNPVLLLMSLSTEREPWPFLLPITSPASPHAFSFNGLFAYTCAQICCLWPAWRSCLRASYARTHTAPHYYAPTDDDGDGGELILGFLPRPYPCLCVCMHALAPLINCSSSDSSDCPFARLINTCRCEWACAVRACLRAHVPCLNDIHECVRACLCVSERKARVGQLYDTRYRSVRWFRVRSQVCTRANSGIAKS